VAQSRARSLAVASYGRILDALYSKRGLPWRVHDEIVRIDPRARRLVPHEPKASLVGFLKHSAFLFAGGRPGLQA
jgi:hypothetical protein